MRKKTETEKLAQATATTAALADTHEGCRNRLLAARDTAKTAETAADQAAEDERALRALLAEQADEPSKQQVDELKRLAGIAAESRVVRDLANARLQAAEGALQQAAKSLRASQRAEAEVAYHEAQLELAARLLELAPLHEQLNETLAQHLAMGGMDRGAGLDAVFAWARAIQAEAAARVPKQAAAPDPNRSVIMLRSVSVDRYGQFNAGETCGFPPEIAASLVAQHDAKWAVDGDFENRNALVRRARGIISHFARMLGRRVTENDVIETGWKAA